MQSTPVAWGDFREGCDRITLATNSEKWKTRKAGAYGIKREGKQEGGVHHSRTNINERRSSLG